MQASRGRLLKELKEAVKSQESGEDQDIQLFADERNILRWTAKIAGPEGTPYEGGVFKVNIAVPEQYPLAPPKANFETRIFHPNIHFKTGEVCLDILKQQWSPAWTLSSVCRAILALLAHPEASSPLNCDAGNLLRAQDFRGYRSLARMYTRMNASSSSLASAPSSSS